MGLSDSMQVSIQNSYYTQILRYEKRIKKKRSHVPTGTWERLRNRPEPTGLGLSKTLPVGQSSICLHRLLKKSFYEYTVSPILDNRTAMLVAKPQLTTREISTKILNWPKGLHSAREALIF